MRKQEMLSLRGAVTMPDAGGWEGSTAAGCVG